MVIVLLVIKMYTFYFDYFFCVFFLFQEIKNLSYN